MEVDGFRWKSGFGIVKLSCMFREGLRSPLSMTAVRVERRKIRKNRGWGNRYTWRQGNLNKLRVLKKSLINK